MVYLTEKAAERNPLERTCRVEGVETGNQGLVGVLYKHSYSRVEGVEKGNQGLVGILFKHLYSRVEEVEKDKQGLVSDLYKHSYVNELQIIDLFSGRLELTRSMKQTVGNAMKYTSFVTSLINC